MLLLIEQKFTVFFSINWHCRQYFIILTARTLVFFSLFVCLFWIFHRTREFFIRMETSSLRLQIYTYVQHPWPSSSEGSLACHTYCDTEYPFIMVISVDPWHSHLLPSVWQLRLSLPVLWLWPVVAWFWTPNPPLAGRSL